VAAINMAALVAPNFLLTKWFKFGKEINAEDIRRSVRGGTGAMSKQGVIDRYNIWKAGFKGFLSEGAWEENIQNAAQDYEKRVAMGDQDTNRVAGLATNMVNNLWGFAKIAPALFNNELITPHSSEDEGAKAILLGAMLGSPISMRSEFLNKA